MEPKSIYEHIRAHLPAEGPGLREGGERLPDEPPRNQQGGLQWAPGAIEGVLTHHTAGNSSPVEERVERLQAALRGLAEHPGPATREGVRVLFIQEEPRTLIGPLLQRLRAAPHVESGRLYGEMKRFLLEGCLRNEVKFALAIFSCACGEEDLDPFRTIGRHEEFTTYVSAAVGRLLPDPIPEWMNLARNVTGWGKISLVELLLKDARPEVRHFLLRYGCRNSAADGYTALGIATTCRLHDALAADDVGRDLLSGAGDILRSLVQDAVKGGPNGTMLGYPHGGVATERFLNHLEPQAATFGDFLTVHSLSIFPERGHKGARQSVPREEQLLACGWDPACTSRIMETCRRILGQPFWVSLAQEALASANRHDRVQGLELAERLGLPVRGAIWLVWRRTHWTLFCGIS